VSSAGEHPGGGDEALAQFIMRLRALGVREGALLDAMERAPRRVFLPRALASYAYRDMNLPLPAGQTASSPSSVIETLRQLALTPKLRVLEIGSGSGWQTALIAAMSRAVAGVERMRTLAEGAEAVLHKLGLRNAVVVHGDGAGGLPMAAPFDRIVSNVTLDGDPSPLLLSQLSKGGFMLTPAVTQAGVQLMRFDPAGESRTVAVIPDAWRAPLVPGVAHHL
jgi:protein-L-isoaspartate(D-aspartate) O-methyltransferase